MTATNTTPQFHRAPEQFANVPSWTYDGAEPSIYTFFEAVALAGLEDQPIRLSADVQRALLGFPVFGRRCIVVHPTGDVTSAITVAYGQDYEIATYPVSVLRRAAFEGKQLRPGTSGDKYLSNQTLQ